MTSGGQQEVQFTHPSWHLGCFYYVVVGSDSGRISILEYIVERNAFESVHMETFGKSGCRRIVPGQYLAVDPKGRAVMIAAVEKQKLVYILNRDAAARLTISSPLEAHKSHSILFHVIGLDVGFENPMFASLELDYADADDDATGEALEDTKQSLVYYELDLGLNHVVRKHSEELEEAANMLIPVPGGNDGPGGLIVCCEDFVTYKNLGEQTDVRVAIPKRQNSLVEADRSTLIVACAAHKTKQMTFFLVQTDQGDIFKIALVVDDDIVVNMQMRYFDTIPVATSLNILKAGFLMSSGEFGNHLLFQIAQLGDDNEAEPTYDQVTEYHETWPTFQPRELMCLVPVDELESFSPIMDCEIAKLEGADSDTPKFFAACGRGSRSTLRQFRHGLEVTEMAVSELPGNPNAVWTVKRNRNDEYDSYIVVSFNNATLVLSIGDTVEEVVDSGFLGTSPTVYASGLGDDSLLHVHPDGIRHIRADKRINEWKCPGRATITRAAVNIRQVVISLSNQELVYFELDAAGQLNEYTERMPMDSDVQSIAIGEVPDGRQRCRFVAVGLADRSVRIVSLDPEDCLTQLSIQVLPVTPSSLCMVAMEDGSDSGDTSTLYLNIGLTNGVMMRTVIDPITGQISDNRLRYLGSKEVKMFRVKTQGKDAVLSLSSRNWLSYPYQGRLIQTPLTYEALEHATSFTSEQCPEGIVAIAGNTLRIIATEKLGAVFNQQAAQLSYTPRKLCVHRQSNTVLVIETDHNCLTQSAKEKAKAQINGGMEVDGEAEEDLPADIFGEPRPGAGIWASMLRAVDAETNETVATHLFDDNESAVSMVTATFHDRGDDVYVLVGTAVNLKLAPRSCDAAFIYSFKIDSATKQFVLLHKTALDDVPGAMCAFQGRVLVSVGRLLRIYDMGKRKLLRKCENKHVPNNIVSVMALGSRIYVSDVQESWHFLKYKSDQNFMVIFADDTLPRWVTTGCVLDYDTICGADKFGNVYLLRLPSGAVDDIDDDPSGTKVIWQRGLLGGAPQKVECVAQFYIGETIKTLQKCDLVADGHECVVYTTLSGGMGILAPFQSKEDLEFFQHMEMYMQQNMPPLCGRDHLSFRSYYQPKKNVIDGDLVEQFNTMVLSKRKDLSDELDRTPPEVSKKLEDIRALFAF
ncbi:splicing factor 3B subunit 3 [Sphaeroforma arctica JP610]|uniref:DNA damage-binding protein 1 n=1 Tax=Sphaeroforma arctica JP610 TaxID=667725 RepID=A0A0L0GBI5_9EUKA|nr:splicing factor 3B subunit 3 [Sphaeroforma arctica JP610]KNC86365.1 splicing factor 3B subunit 3 [Sphaeroforma arctica JP610]|eukprot:XP_014160267.1 splicing factor 3B subunit 3 [Sphaeroforma arctica JP610]